MTAPYHHSGAHSLNVAISFPAELIEQLDARAKVEGLTRSALIRKAAAFYLTRMAEVSRA